MSDVIAFVSQQSPEEDALWIKNLSACMPEEAIVRFSDLDEQQRQNAVMAIVANPNPADIAKLPNLVWIHSVWAGVERLVGELGDCSFEIVRLIDPELARTMAEAVLSWSLYLHRDMPGYAIQQKNHQWIERPYVKMTNRTVGILGLGALGAAAAKLLNQTGFNVLGWSRSPKDINGVTTRSGTDGLADVTSKSDILINLLPMTDQTCGLINRSVFNSLPNQAGFINFGRGAVVVTNDMVDALDNGSLSHAVLDVFEVEPLPVDSALWDHSGITVLPHISAPTDVKTASDIVAKNIYAYRQKGILPATVDRKVGY